jgi:hypothetical protein
MIDQHATKMVKQRGLGRSGNAFVTAAARLLNPAGHRRAAAVFNIPWQNGVDRLFAEIH